MTRKQKGPGFSMSRGSKPNFKDLGSSNIKPAVPKDNGPRTKQPTEEELIAMANQKWGDKGPSINPKQDMLNKIDMLNKKKEADVWHENKPMDASDVKLLSNLVANYKKGVYNTKDKKYDPNLIDAGTMGGGVHSIGDTGIRKNYLEKHVIATPEDEIKPSKNVDKWGNIKN